MTNLRVIDEIGNQQDFETNHVPLIGELIMLIFGKGGEPVREHYSRVKDVMYRLDNKPENQAAILVEEVREESWPD